MRYLITFSYDGTNYNGYQKQPDYSTVQGNIEDALYKINSNNPVKIHATGRTDKGVHAINQKAHFDLKEMEPSSLKRSLNYLVNDDIYIKNVEIVDCEFHARYHCKRKEYIYKMNLGEYIPLEKNYIYQYNKSLDIDKINKSLKELIGTHNFKSFTIEKDYENHIRTIYTAECSLENNILIFTFIGDGFMRYMVRNIVGTLIKIGEGKVLNIKDILNPSIEAKTGVIAPACGLYLNNIWY